MYLFAVEDSGSTTVAIVGIIVAGLAGPLTALVGHFLELRAKRLDAKAKQHDEQREKLLAAYGECIYHVENLRSAADSNTTPQTLAALLAEASRAMMNLGALQPNFANHMAGYVTQLTSTHLDTEGSNLPAFASIANSACASIRSQMLQDARVIASK